MHNRPAAHRARRRPRHSYTGRHRQAPLHSLEACPGGADEERQYGAAAAAADFPQVRFSAAARAASLALDRGDVAAARRAVELARAALPDDAAPLVLEARIALALHDAGAAQAAARAALM